MPFFPTLEQSSQTQVVTRTFLGYNRNPEIGEGQNGNGYESAQEFFDMQNMSSDYYPMLSNRKPRGTVAELSNPGGCCDKGELVYVDNGKLYYNGERIDGIELVDGEKQFISMGVKLIIWPDKIAVDVLTGQFEYFSPDVDAIATAMTENSITASVFPVSFADIASEPRVGGSATEWQPIAATYGKSRDAIVFDAEAGTWTLPAPTYKGLWSFSGSPYPVIEKDDIVIPSAMTADPKARVPLGRYIPGQPVELPDATKNDGGFYGIFRRLYGIVSVDYSNAEMRFDVYRSGAVNRNFANMFKVGDVVNIESGDGRINSTLNTVIGVEPNTNKIFFDKPLENYVSRPGSDYHVRIWLPVPEMDYITEASNRIWGCKYGEVNGENINEIYACALGDYRSWNRYKGISTDSYTASVGTDGKWTGAATYQGNPIFFKENCIHKVFVSASGAHQISDISARGVQDGCANSIAIVGDRLIYKSRSGIMYYDNSVPQVVSDKLGNVKYHSAAAGSLDDKYYVSMCDEGGAWHMFVLDTAKGLWHREDGTHASSFARVRNELYYIDRGNNKLMCVTGSDGEPELDMEWYATTGLVGYTTVEQKYISRFNIRMTLPVGSDADIYIMYDSNGIWEHNGHMRGVGTGSFMLPVRPRRCDHFAVRIEGHGEVRVYSISKILEKGSDVL